MWLTKPVIFNILTVLQKSLPTPEALIDLWVKKNLLTFLSHIFLKSL